MTRAVGRSVVARKRLLHPLVRLLHGYQWLAQRELLACAVVLVLTLGLRAALLPWLPIPLPRVTDEFSHLLAADTYAHGRLTNPTHPLWQHFETFHVLMQPTYQSKYQPLQGLVLAFGQKFFGEPWIGQYLSAGLLCAALCWMLQGWVSPGWALLGALLFVCRVGVLSYWMNSYMGTAVPGIGGALVLGAMARILWRGQFGHSITWALGLTILALSRPYDAAVLGCTTTAMLVWFLIKSRTPAKIIGVSVAVPAFAVLTICAAVVAYNDYRVSGSVVTLPYTVYDQQYVMATTFAIIPLNTETVYRHPVMRHLAEREVELWTGAHAHPVAQLVGDLFDFDYFLFPFPVLMIPVLLCPYDLHTPQERATVFLLLVFALMVAPLIGVLPHYASAFAGVLYARLLHSFTRLASWRPLAKPLGRALIALFIGFTAGAFCDSVLGLIQNGRSAIALGHDIHSHGIAIRTLGMGPARHSIMQTLRRQPGRQLVLVRYTPQHDLLDEWVYNRADIDTSQIVWAREMGPEQDRSLLEYFHDRRVWLLEPDYSPPKLSPYPREAVVP